MKLTKIIKDVFNAGEADYSDTQKLMDLDSWDSMAHMQFIVMLEDEYSVNFTGNEIASMITIDDIKKTILSKGVEL